MTTPNAASAGGSAGTSTGTPSGGGTGGASSGSPGASSPAGGTPSGGAPNGGTVTNPFGAGQQLAGQGAQPPAQRQPLIMKHKAKIGDAEHELDVDVGDFVRSMKHKYRADGADVEATLDELLEQAPLARGAFRRMSEAAETKRAAEERATQFESRYKRLSDAIRNPEMTVRLLEQGLGRDRMLQLFERELVGELQRSKLPPEQRAALDQQTERERRLDERERQLRETEERGKREAAERTKREAEQLTEHYRQTWPRALEGVGIKATDYTMRLFASFKQQAKAAGFSATDEQIARAVQTEVRTLLGGLDPNTIREAAGPQLQQVRAQEIAEMNTNQPGRVAQEVRQPEPRVSRPDPQENETLEQYRERMRAEADERLQQRIRGR